MPRHALLEVPTFLVAATLAGMLGGCAGTPDPKTDDQRRLDDARLRCEAYATPPQTIRLSVGWGNTVDMPAHANPLPSVFRRCMADAGYGPDRVAPAADAR